VFFFLPGGMGIAFVKQYAQSGVGIPLMGPGFSFSQDVLGAIGDAALGAKNSASWSKDLDNAANKTFVETFQKEYNRLPSIYAAQAYDTANLIVAAAGKASVKDADAFRAALKAADFQSVRGKFKFNTNQHPIQDIYVREVIKEGDVLTNKIIGTAFTDHGDAYAKDCALK
jgi:branched-chain amino acid transport system substrate-binding protein